MSKDRERVRPLDDKAAGERFRDLASKLVKVPKSEVEGIVKHDELKAKPRSR